jgi:hypothetical protein
MTVNLKAEDKQTHLLIRILSRYLQICFNEKKVIKKKRTRTTNILINKVDHAAMVRGNQVCKYSSVSRVFMDQNIVNQTH